MPHMTGMVTKERALRFGRTATMVGVLAESGEAPGRADRPDILLLNSGILHRAGASRLHVTLARELAEDGFASLRFDFSGIGDSEPRRDALPFEESAVMEAREAMDHLAATRDSERFILMGLCSGADVAFHVALEDPRVVGLVQLDAWAYRTWRYHVNHYARRIFKLDVWKKSIRSRWKAFVERTRGSGDAGAGSRDYVPPRYLRRFPPREEVAEGLRSLVARDVNLFYFFSGDQEEHFNYREQYEDSFPEVDFRKLLQVEYMEECDHIITDLRHQEVVLEAIRRWVADRYAPRNVEKQHLEPAGAPFRPAPGSGGHRSRRPDHRSDSPSQPALGRAAIE